MLNATQRPRQVYDFLPGGGQFHTSNFQQLTTMLLHAACDAGFLADLPAEDIPSIVWLASFHDIGKLAIPTSVLYKEERLTTSEAEIMRNHTVYGAEFMKAAAGTQADSPLARYAFEICRHHHERWDGCGYPDHLREDKIPRYVQVISLVDSYDALTAPRAYRDAYSHEEAVRIIFSGACGAYCPQLIALFRENVAAIRRLYHKDGEGLVISL